MPWPALEVAGAPAPLMGGAALLAGTWFVLNFVLTIVVFLYAIDALYAERKDKSILFWRSLPGTDTETVVSKLFVGLLVAPLITLGIVLVTQLILLLLASLAILVGGGNPIELLWGPLPLFRLLILVMYTVMTASLWFAPFVAYFLFCSSFAKRSALLWVFLPVSVVVMLEGIVLQSTQVLQAIGLRLQEAWYIGFDVSQDFEFGDEEMEAMVLNGELTLLDLIAPLKFLTEPGLWGGFAIAAAFVAGAVYFRRLRA